MNSILDKEVKVLAIFYYGRSGSYFLHSLMDSHPNLLSIPPGCLMSFFDFWDQNRHLSNAEIIQNFLSDYAEMINPDVTSRGVCHGSAIRGLGADKNITLKIDANAFSCALQSLLAPIVTLTRRHLFVAVHYAYHRALGLQIPNDFVIVFQAHNYSDKVVLDLLNDFPSTKFLHSTRYPLQALGSHIKHHAVDLREKDGFNGANLISLLAAAIEGGVENFPGYNKIARAIRLEDLHTRPKEILQKLCSWLDIPWHHSLLESTINGHTYSFPSSYSGSISGFTTQTISATHDDIYTSFDKFRFELIFKNKCQAWKYPVSSFVDDGIVEKLMLYPYKMEQFFSTEELKAGYAKKLREYLLTAYKNRDDSLQPITLLDIDADIDNCGWSRQLSENELFCTNAVFNKHAFELYYTKALDAFKINDYNVAHSMIKYALVLAPNSHSAVSLSNQIRSTLQMEATV